MWNLELSGPSVSRYPAREWEGRAGLGEEDTVPIAAAVVVFDRC